MKSILPVEFVAGHGPSLLSLPAGAALVLDEAAAVALVGGGPPLDTCAHISAMIAERGGGDGCESGAGVMLLVAAASILERNWALSSTASLSKTKSACLAHVIRLDYGLTV